MGLAQHPIDARFRGDRPTPVRQCRHHRAWRQVSKLGLIGDRHDRLALLVGELMGRITPRRRRQAAIGLHRSVLAPALQGSGREPEPLTGGAETGAGGTGFLEMSDHVSARPQLDFPSSGCAQSA